MKVNFTDCRNKEQRSCINDLGFSIQEFIFFALLAYYSIAPGTYLLFFKASNKKNCH